MVRLWWYVIALENGLPLNNQWAIVYTNDKPIHKYIY